MAYTYCILLVEDDPEQTILFTAVLKKGGYTLNTVLDAETAITRLHEEQFDLALIDWDLPGMNGDALIRHIKTEFPAVKTLLFSNHNDVDLVAQSSGADAWMRKSEGVKQLLQIITDLLPPA